MIISTKIKNVTEIGKYNFNLHVKLFSYFHSGMLHTGFDAVADTLELQCIQQTFPKMFGVLEGFGLPYNKIGATMVAWTQEQVFFLFHVEFRYVLIYIPHGPSSNAHLLELLKQLYIFFCFL